MAFQEAGLAWTWSAATCAALEDLPGLRRRITDFAHGRGEMVDVPSLEARARAIFRRMLREVHPAPPRRTRHDRAARARGIRLALLTRGTTEDAVVHGGADAGGCPELAGSAGLRLAPASNLAPHPRGLRAFGLHPGEAVAVECLPTGAAAAAKAGIRVVAVPGTSHRLHAFPAAAERAEVLSPALLGLDREPRTVLSA